jgi:hypothetical protein
MDWLGKPLVTYWLIVFGMNYAAMVSAAGRVRPFNTQLIFRRGGIRAGLLRFCAGAVVLNLLPLGYGLWIAYAASNWSNPSLLTLFAFTLASFATYGFWRVFGAFCADGCGLYKGDPLAGSGTPLGEALKEVREYKLGEHVCGALIYFVIFPAPLLICWWCR